MRRSIEVRSIATTPTFFDGIDPGEIEPLLAGLERRRFPAGATVIAAGDLPNELYILQGGHAEVLVADRSGEEHAVGQVHAGGTLGEMSLFTGQPAVGEVRAVTELDVLVMSGREFERFADEHPVIYRNLGVILSERLARTNRLAVRGRPGRLVVLRDFGAPPAAGAALAASVAWHTCAPTLLLVVGDDGVPGPLPARSEGGRTPPRAEVDVLPAEEARRPGGLAARLTRAFERYEHVLLQVRGDEGELDVGPARSVDLAPPRLDLPGRADPAAPLVRAWSNGAPDVHPWRHGVTHVGELGDGDDAALAEGVLGPGTPAGGSLGWLARDLTGLKVGVALGAGSLRGYAHIGVLGVLEREGIPVDYICGTSVGGAVAAMYATGFDVPTCARGLDAAGTAMFRPTVPLKSVLSTRALGDLLERMGGGRRIEELPRPLALVAADLLTRREIVFRRGEMWLAVVASCAIPGIFPAQPIGPYMVVDGGVLNPVPANVAASMGADVVIAVRLGSIASPPETEAVAAQAPTPRPSVLTVTLRSIEIMQSRIATEPGEARTITITPDLPELPGGRLRNWSAGRGYIPAGEAAAEEALPRIAAALPWLRRRGLAN